MYNVLIVGYSEGFRVQEDKMFNTEKEAREFAS